MTSTGAADAGKSKDTWSSDSQEGSETYHDYDSGDGQGDAGWDGGDKGERVNAFDLTTASQRPGFEYKLLCVQVCERRIISMCAFRSASGNGCMHIHIQTHPRLYTRALARTYVFTSFGRKSSSRAEER